jgi:hypothetical protein
MANHYALVCAAATTFAALFFVFLKKALAKKYHWIFLGRESAGTAGGWTSCRVSAANGQTGKTNDGAALSGRPGMG